MVRLQQNPRGEVHVLATLDERSYVTEHNQANPDDQIQSHMNSGEGVGRDHPIAWCQHYQGGRAWYTGRGHTEEVFDQEEFIQHVVGGIVWPAGSRRTRRPARSETATTMRCSSRD